MLVIKGKSSKELKDLVKTLYDENKSLKSKCDSLEKKLAKPVPVKVVTKVKTKTEPFSEYRKLAIAKQYAKRYIAERIIGTFDTKASDLSQLALHMADFCTENDINLRQLGVLLYASNFRSVRKKDLYSGRPVGQWYFQTIEALFKKDLIIRVNPEMKKWIYFSITPNGEKLVRGLKVKLRNYLVEDDKEAGGIERSSA